MVIAMRNGVDDRFSYGVRREFVSGRCGDAGSTRADGAVDLAQHEIKPLIGLCEEVSAIYLYRGKGTTVLRTVTVDALGLGGTVEPLRIGSKKEDGGVCRFFQFQ